MVESASLLPSNDPTLMFTAAGMVQFKDTFTGKETRAYTRATSSQKCIRISGKHNDLENVGVTARHHTFFEMLGNFSFGDYFKEDAIAYAWELLTTVWKIPKERLVITVFGGEQGIAADDEARNHWKKVANLGDDRIIGMGMKDNFWQAGDVGPCGPCTEIHYFHGGEPDLSRFNEEPRDDGSGWMEIWNLVFMQFDRSINDGETILAPLPKPCVDTGAGLERIASVLQGKVSNYDTDLLAPLVEMAATIAGKRYGGTLADDDVSMRVIADHARTTAFLIAEGVFPDRAAREYVLRRVMRRAIRHGHRLGIARPFLHEVTARVAQEMGESYPELRRAQKTIESVTLQEEVRFRETIDRGLKLLDEAFTDDSVKSSRTLGGDTAFRLYDTFGFPLDLTSVIAKERGFEVDELGYQKALDEARVRSEGSKVGEAAVLDIFRALADRSGSATRFVGYERESSDATLLALARGASLVTEAGEGDDVSFVTDETPFYAESGGQAGDCGIAKSALGAVVEVTDTQKPFGGIHVHTGKVRTGKIAQGERITLVVDQARRTATRRNHSATHLLHWALREVLGPQATQKGSLVGPERLRFDFAHGKPVAPEELLRIEDLVNAKILENAAVVTEVLPIEQARAKGAVAMFGEKYGETVRVLTMTSDSVEFCGGTHARALGEIGLFKIVSEGGIAAGVRRIEALTGINSLLHVRASDQTLQTIAKNLKVNVAETASRVERLVDQSRAHEKEIGELKRQAAMGGGAGGASGIDAYIAEARQVGEKKVLAVQVDGLEAAVQRELAEKLRDRLGPSVVLVGSVTGGKAQLVVTVEKSLTGTHRAGDLVKSVADAVGGSGGGRPDMAQAGGTRVEGMPDAIQRFYALVQ